MDIPVFPLKITQQTRPKILYLQLSYRATKVLKILWTCLYLNLFCWGSKARIINVRQIIHYWFTWTMFVPNLKKEKWDRIKYYATNAIYIYLCDYIDIFKNILGLSWCSLKKGYTTPSLMLHYFLWQNIQIKPGLCYIDLFCFKLKFF